MNPAVLNRMQDAPTIMSSSPRMVTLGAHNSCNAACIFCLEGRYTRFSLDLYKNFFEKKMGHMIRQAEKVTFTGFGEVLWLPDVEDFLDHLNKTIPDVWKIFTTNGTPLRPPVIERLLQSKFVIQVSLHASNAALHEELTRLPGAFAEILENIRNLCRLRRERGLGEDLYIVVKDLITTRNIDDLPDLIERVEGLNVPEVQCSYMTMYTPDHIELSCFFDQERTNHSIDRAVARLDAMQSSLSVQERKAFKVVFPPKFGSARPKGASSLVCADPWEQIYVEGQGTVLPCCNWGSHIGDLKRGDDVDALWNNDFYQDLRSSMASGDPKPDCSNCVKYRGYNVDNLLSHLTNRPQQRETLQAAIHERSL